MTRTPKLFLSHSHADLAWKDIILKHLSPWNMEIWSDSKIEAGTEWMRELEIRLNSCSAVLALISPPYLSSKFIVQVELPMILKRVDGDDLRILCVHVAASSFEATRLRRYQSLNDPARPLNSLAPGQIDLELKRISQAIASGANATASWAVEIPVGTSPSPPAVPSTSEKGTARTEVISDVLDADRIGIGNEGGSRDILIRSRKIKARDFVVGAPPGKTD